MLNWLLLGISIANVIANVIVITVSYLNKITAKNELQLKGFIKAMVKTRNGNRVKMDAIDRYGNEKEIEFHATNGVSDDIRVGQTIKVL